MFCPTCGIDHHAEPPVIEAEAEVTEAAIVERADVEIARIQADRDVALARINAGVDKAIAENETVTALAHAEGRAEGQAEIIDAVTPDPEPAPEPVVVVNDAAAETEPDTGPPEIETAPTAPSKKSNPWW